MTKESTERFLLLLEKQNARVAARNAEQPKPEPRVDKVRTQREQERREKYGQLRAREHSSKQRKGKVARSVFGHVDLT